MELSLSNRGRLVALALLALAGLAGCGDDDDGTPGRDGGTTRDAASAATIAEIATGDPDFSMLVAAASRAGLVSTLSGEGPLTVFAPTNAAFEASGITMAQIESLPVDALTAILAYHVIGGATVRAADIEPGPVTTAAQLSIVLATTGGVTINGGNAVTGGANVVTADIAASNGVVHVIDRVLLPPTVADLARYAGLTSLAGALEAQGLDEVLAGAGPFTVFAPTNAAFEALGTLPTGDALTTVLTGHVVSGRVASNEVPARASSLAENAYGDNLTLLFDTTSGVVINGGPRVVVADVRATNGIVHVIDAVIVPMNVVDAAEAAGLTRLLAAVGAASPIDGDTTIAEALAAQQPYTVFAPTDAAFEALAATPAPDALRDVLLYHVLDPETFPSPVLSSELPAAATDLETLAAADVPFVPGPPPTVDGASIAVADVVVTNGVVHVIDAVMLPSD